MSDWRVLIADAVSPECDAILERRGIDVDRAVGVSRDELKKILPEYHGMIVRSAVKVDAELIGAMEKMRGIGRAGAGVDKIDVTAATGRGIVVMNTPGGNTISAAEHSVAMMLSMLRKIPAANARLRNGVWDRKTFVGTELMGKRVGVLGLGRIGREVATRVQSFGALVHGYDPVLSADAVGGLGITPSTFEEMIEGMDILTIHIPLVASTRGLIGAAELGRMRRGSFIVNCARGGIVDEAALLAALESGQIAGAALDVFAEEPPTFPSALIDHPNVVATPHIAASTNEAQERVALDIADQIADFFEGKGARGVVNAVGLEASLRSEALPLMQSAETLGAFMGQLAGEGNLRARLVAYGADAVTIVRGLGAALLAGLVSKGADGSVNAINAEMLAERRGIELTTEGEGAHDQFTTLLVAEVSAGNRSWRAGVTVFGLREPRLVMIDDVWLDVKPAGRLILFQNVDRPGVLAAASSLLASRGVNIADVSLGRREGTGHALTVMRVDDEIDASLLEELRGLESVDDVRLVVLPELG